MAGREAAFLGSCWLNQNNPVTMQFLLDRVDIGI